MREWLAERGAEAAIPCNPRRNRIILYNAVAYRQRNLIERMLGRLKDFRRIATRYDKLVRNFLSAILIAALVIWRLCRVRTLEGARSCACGSNC